ncbi:MAG: OmpA family protein [Bacteroidia bacterium]
MKYIPYLLCVLLTISIVLNAQSTKPTVKNSIKKQLAPVSCDCKSLISIPINQSTIYGPTVAPIGYGELQEITAFSKSDKLNFEKEHNSAWYLLTINHEGELVFEITPTDSTNDYDFLLYQYTDSNFCEQLQQKQLIAIRGNLARNNTKEKGITGLNGETDFEFSAQGVNNNWSKSIQVKAGNKYVLVLDNVYPNGNGHTIKFNFVKNVSINGTVTDAANVPLANAEVLLEDNDGNTIKQINTDNKGTYAIDLKLKEGINYSLSFSADSSFIETQIVNTKLLYKKPNAFTDIKTVLPKLKKGEKYIVTNINFYGDSDELIKQSYPSVYALTKLMKKNKKMVIRIEGHVNGEGSRTSASSHQLLSEQRAKKIYTLLAEKGIENERMSTIGFSDKKMLYPHPKNGTEAEKNRRVEINVLSID